MGVECVGDCPRLRMQNKIIRAAGWSFQSPLSNLMILYDDAQLSDLVDNNSIHHLSHQIRNIESEDLGTFLKLIPPLSELAKTLPQSLPLLDLIYVKCEKLKNENATEFPARELCCVQLVQHVLWWIAFHHESNRPSAPQGKVFPQPELSPCSSAFPFDSTVRAHLRSIFGVISRECPSILEDVAQEKVLLEGCLESLGCHGLVNCSTGLIRIFDAVALEMFRHQERVKGSQQKLKELQKMKSFSGKQRCSV
uniref:NR LBD domain-containing protein n=1 Tax=Steinernema glaseri TaxID=37863 RepID=A0A1I7ZKT7_9BILA